MKKLFIALALCSLAGIAFAQNVQLHYDFGKGKDNDALDRNYVTATFEFFKPDKMGSTFFFVDFDFNGDKDGISVSYMEIARNLKITKDFPVMAHLEYNGGHFGTHFKDGGSAGVSFRNMVILGGAYDWKITKGFTLGTMLGYKYIQDTDNGADFQATVTWFKPLGKKFLLAGFADLWTEDKTGTDDKKFVFITEPQIWYSLNDHFRVGSEVEISSNFISNKLEVMPTLAVCWDI